MDLDPANGTGDVIWATSDPTTDGDEARDRRGSIGASRARRAFDGLTGSVLFAGTVGVVTFLVLWELVVRLFDVQAFVLLPPSEIVDVLTDTPRYYLDHALVTARHALIGIGLSLLAATALGMLLAMSTFAERAAQPVLVLIMVAPWVAYINSIVIWLGGGDRPVLFLVSLVTMPAFTFAVVTGLRSADPAIRDVLASAGASRWEMLWRVRAPTAMPYVTTAARFNLGLAVAAAYFSEGGALVNDGLGAAGRHAQAQNNGEVLWASVMCTALLGIAALMVLTIFERTVLHWHVSQRGTVSRGRDGARRPGRISGP